MRLSSMADYAVVTMSAAARHCGGARTSATELASETGIPLPTVQKLVSLLSKAGLLRSLRGASGGLQLARPAAAITLADIVEAVEGPIALTACVESGRHDCVAGRQLQRPAALGAGQRSDARRAGGNPADAARRQEEPA